MQCSILNLVQLDDRKTDRTWSLGSTGSEETARLAVHEWLNLQIEALAAMEMVKQDDVGKAIEILQARTVVLKHLDRARHAGHAGGLNRHALRFRERRMDHANRMEFNLHSVFRQLVQGPGPYSERSSESALK